MIQTNDLSRLVRTEDPLAAEMVRLKTVLFDLDGTLVDTAPDLAETLNRLLVRHRQPERSLESIRPYVSHGTIGMLGFAFGLTEGDPAFAAMRREFLDIYENHLCHQSVLFEGMEKVLDYIESNGLSWGVVTNKPDFLTRPLMRELELDQRSVCIISGDTLSTRKPDPAPMLHAAKLAGNQPEECVYVGDAERDIEAGRRAGMRTLVARYGYIESHEDPQRWQADGSIDSPLELIDWIKKHG
jgi:phosphoglycolate phosphatase